MSIQQKPRAKSVISQRRKSKSKIIKDDVKKQHLDDNQKHLHITPQYNQDKMNTSDITNDTLSSSSSISSSISNSSSSSSNINNTSINKSIKINSINSNKSNLRKRNVDNKSKRRRSKSESILLDKNSIDENDDDDNDDENDDDKTLFDKASDAASYAATSVMNSINDTKIKATDILLNTETIVSDKFNHTVDVIKDIMQKRIMNGFEDEIYSWQAYEKAMETYRKLENRLNLFYHELKPWQRDNIYIPTGYRKLTNSYVGCVKTLLHAHNETVNIFSHLLGGIWFVTLFYFCFTNMNINDFPSIKWSDYIVLSTFLTCAIACLLISSFFHMVVCHSENVCKLWNRADYAGIVLLIVGSFVPTLYYSFYCHVELMTLYLSTIVILGTITLSFCILERFSLPEYRATRTLMFVLLGLFGVVPMIHACYIYGVKLLYNKLNLDNIILMGLLYITGALIYVYRIPERWFPGKFDIVGHSHQIFHCLVVAAAITHYFGLVDTLKYVHDENPTCEYLPSELIMRANSTY